MSQKVTYGEVARSRLLVVRIISSPVIPPRKTRQELAGVLGAAHPDG